ncbi:unnamed protein product [Alopecurus aequalis]
MENKFLHTSEMIREFTIESLRGITNNFSPEHKIGGGGYGQVYKGVLDNGEAIALKKLHYIPELDDTTFANEFSNLMKARHKNITRLVGYCYHRGHQIVEHKGVHIFALVEDRVLGIEYLQNGSLDKYLSDESCGLDWHIRYKIINGICEGLNYLHNGYKDPIYHMDLKPANILLDKDMTPKIGDFGLSKLFPPEHTFFTTKIIGTFGYMPPEYIERGEITNKFDVFSLGVIIIKVIAGDEGYSACPKFSPREFVDHVHEKWRKRLGEIMSSRTSEEVVTCLKIALECLEVDRVRRPTINEVVTELNKINSLKSSPISESGGLRCQHPNNQYSFSAHMSDTEEDDGEKTDEGHTGAEVELQRLRVGETCEWFTATSSLSTTNDEDASSTNTEPVFNISPNGKSNRNITSWICGGIVGSGSFGTVYEAISDEGFFFAVKEVNLLYQGRNAEQSIRALRQEIALLSQLEHENIVQYYGTDKEESKVYIFIELVTQGSLLSLYKKYKLGDFQVSAYTRQILNGLVYLHERNVVHRDIKCANILVHANGSVKLADFGLAKAMSKINMPRLSEGSVYWMAPEVINPKNTYGPAADMWSLGCTVLEMLTRQIPYPDVELKEAFYKIGRGEQPPMPSYLSEIARDFIVQCVRVDPEKRPTALELLAHPFVNKPLRVSFDS